MGTVHAVVMAGGSGTRFWPASRATRPKQFLPLVGGKPMIAATLERLEGVCAPERIWVATNKRQAKALTKLLPNLPSDRLILEPEARDTGPAIALAAATIAAVDPDATMLVLPSDHAIEPADAFRTMLAAGIALADERRLVTFGVRPTHPATGFGYLELGAPIAGAALPAFEVASFREKPDRATAEDFLRRGGFLWNSGIFAWRLSALRAAMEKAEPMLASATTAMFAGLQRKSKAAVQKAFAQAPAKSIDYAVMERAEQVAVVEANVRWHDVGSFPALADVLPPDAHGNVVAAANGATHVLLDSHRNVVYADGDRTVALLGVEDLVVVAVGDAVLVCKKDRAHDLKALVQQLREQGRDDRL